MNLARARVFFIIDLLILCFIVFFTCAFYSPVKEPLVKGFVIVFSFLIFIYTFDGYELTTAYPYSIVYTSFLIIVFSFSLSALVNYVIFFKTYGRKIYLLIGLFSFLYLMFRYSVLFKMFASIKKRVYVLGAINLPDLKGIEVINIDSCDQLNDIDFYTIIIVSDGFNMGDDDLKQLISLKLRGYKVMTDIDFFEFFLRKVPVNLIEAPSYFLNINVYRHYEHFFRRLYIFAKRLLDIFGALFLLVFSSPVLLLTAIAIRLESDGEIIFKQKRSGLNGREFILYKFRSMKKDAEKDGARWATKNDDRVTKVGKVIRKLRIDELPQLYNVLKGDMSLIGPRPERPEFDVELKKKIPFYCLRYLVKPGLTGWAQINYPYGSSVEDAEQKLNYDLYYVKNASLFLDIEIALKTLKVIFFAKGI